MCVCVVVVCLFVVLCVVVVVVVVYFGGILWISSTEMYIQAVTQVRWVVLKISDGCTRIYGVITHVLHRKAERKKKNRPLSNAIRDTAAQTKSAFFTMSVIVIKLK